jgi:hypothetical protein
MSFGILYKSSLKENWARYQKCKLVMSGSVILEFLTRFSKYIQISNFKIIRPVGVELFHMDGHEEDNSRISLFLGRI